MSEHTKEHHTKHSYIEVTVSLPSNKKMHYKIPNTKDAKVKLTDFLQSCKQPEENVITPWNEAMPWKKLAADRINKHSKAGLILRGARYREGISQKELAKRSGISQDNISRIENGKRTVGKKLAQKFAEVLNFDYKLLIDL